MPCDCSLEAQNEKQLAVLKILLVINAALFLMELIVGIYADSAGVLADSLDMFADALVYGVGIYAVGKNAAEKNKAAKLSGYCQLSLAIVILIELIRKVAYGSEPKSLPMLLVSFAALIANSVCLYLLSKEKSGDAHMRASWIFTRTDVMANAGVIVSAILVALLKTRLPDLVIGGIILALVLYGSYQILSDAPSTKPEG